VLAYIQARDYKKGDKTPDLAPLPATSLLTLTRLAKIASVRKVTGAKSERFYIDLKLLGYPYDRNQDLAKEIIKELRKTKDIPMQIYVAPSPDPGTKNVFSQNVPDDECFASVIDALGQPDSQFCRDTFWRISKITTRRKSVIPFVTLDAKPAEIEETIGPDNRKEACLKIVDQSTMSFHIQFYRTRESYTEGYRIRRIKVESSLKALSESAPNTLTSRSFGREVVTVNIPSTSSLSDLDVRYTLETQNHDGDERKDYPYGPRIGVLVRYRKPVARIFWAVLAICFATAMFTWGSTNGLGLWLRILAAVLSVISTLYALYVWSDDISLDKARR